MFRSVRISLFLISLAALVGLVLLGQGLRWYEWAAIGCVVVASAGAART